MPWVPWVHHATTGQPADKYTYTWVPDNATVTKYNPPAASIVIMGIVAGSATLTHLAYDNATGSSAQLTQTIFDTTTRADSAQILLTNATGSTKIVRGAVIRAKAITMLSGTEGFLNDKYVDYESIANNGELKLEIGNNFICTFNQVNKLADYYWKNNKFKRHIYTISMPGMQTFFEMGEWYTLTIGSPGTAEYISSVVECYSIRCSLTFEDIGVTQIAFREMYQNWVFNSNEVARSIASGQFSKWPGQLGVTVASSTYIGTADYYCDGTADEVEINAAIVYLNSKGGGQLQLTDGTYYTTAAVNQSFNNIIAQGMQNTIIKKNCNDYAWKIMGTAGAHISNSIIQNIRFTRDSADTNGVSMVYFIYADYCKIRSCFIDSCYFQSKLDTCTNCVVENNIFTNGYGILDILSSSYISISNNYAYSNGGIIFLSASYSIVESNKLILNGGGVDIGGSYNTIQNNFIKDNSVYGIKIESGSRNMILNNSCQFNGKNLIDHADCESATPPAVYGETADTLTNATFAQSAAQYHAGSDSYLFTKTIAAGTAASAYLTDNVTTTDMHGMFANHEYTFDPWVYIPAGGMTGTNISIVIDEYYSAAWHATTQACANTYNAWQRPTVTHTLNALTTGFRVGFLVAAAEALNTTFYADDIEHFDTNPITNDYLRNFYDAGTDTQVG